MENEKSFIRFSHVTKKFGDFKALDDISLDIPKGCFTTLLGPSGCGKTTLMRQLAGFSEPDEGQIFVDGKLMNGLPPFPPEHAACFSGICPVPAYDSL